MIELSIMTEKIKRGIIRSFLILKLMLITEQFLKSKRTLQVDKIKKIKSISTFFNIQNLIETGTYLGTTTKSVASSFDKVFSIELNEELAKEAKKYLRKNKNVKIIHGDSGVELKNILSTLNQKVCFWLDAHYSGGITAISKDFGDTPISKELEIIFTYWINGNVILIDDARLFDGTNNYPTIDDLIKFINSKKLNLHLFINKDIIHIY